MASALNGTILKVVLLSFMLLGLAHAWPSMGKKKPSHAPGDSTIGPTCTLGAHNWLPQYGPCPPSSDSGANRDVDLKEHVWPKAFTIDWDFYFINNPNYPPPYNPLPKHDFNVTKGHTYYNANYEGGAMREVYDQLCIPIFTSGVFSKSNNFSCDFLNIASTQTAYLITHGDRPSGAPPCCIIGQPFHPPPIDFARNLTQKSSVEIAGVMVDWSSQDVPSSGGPFFYGFIQKTSHDYSTPYAFWMMGAPQIATWMYQRFYNLQVEKPDNKWWQIPDACNQATVCPGWE